MRRLFVILLAALLLAACQTQPAEGTATPTPTHPPAPTLTRTPTVTPTPTLSPEEQREQALREALSPEVYANLAEYGLLERVDLDKGVLSVSMVGQAEQEYTIPIAELAMNVEQQKAYQQDMLRLQLMFGEESVKFFRNEAQGKGYLYLENVSFSEGLPKYTGWLEVDLPGDEARSASRPTIEEWLTSFENAQPADYARIPEDPKSQEALEFYRANLRANIEAMLALPSWQVMEMKAMLGGVKPGELVELQRDLGLNDAQILEIAEKLTGKTRADLEDLAKKFPGQVFYDSYTGEEIEGPARPAQVLELLARLDGTLQYQRFQQDLEPQFRQVLADDYHKKTPEEIEAEVGRIRSQLFGAFSQEELRDLAGKLGMEGAAEAEEGKIIDWLGKNYHWLKTTNPFEVQILRKNDANNGLMTLDMKILGAGRNVRILSMVNEAGETVEYALTPMFISNWGPNGPTVLPITIAVPGDTFRNPTILGNFIEQIMMGQGRDDYDVKLVLALFQDTYNPYNMGVNWFSASLNQTGEYIETYKFELVWSRVPALLSGANGWEGIEDVGVIENAFGPNGYVYSGIGGNILSGYIQDYFFPSKKFQFKNRVFLLLIMSK